MYQGQEKDLKLLSGMEAESGSLTIEHKTKKPQYFQSLNQPDIFQTFAYKLALCDW